MLTIDSQSILAIKNVYRIILDWENLRTRLISQAMLTIDSQSILAIKNVYRIILDWENLGQTT